MFVFFFTVIGRGGEQINKLQSETGAKIQVAPGTEMNFTVVACMISALLCVLCAYSGHACMYTLMSWALRLFVLST